MDVQRVAMARTSPDLNLLALLLYLLFPLHLGKFVVT